MRSFLLGVVVGLVVIIGITLIYLGSGAFDVAATSKPGLFEGSLAPWARDASIESRAPKGPNPFAGEPGAVGAGFEHYRESCVICHGAPGVRPDALAQGLNPSAPRLWSADVQETPEGQTFWVIRNGIRMTGMPAFAPTHSDEDIWDMVAFVRHLNTLTPPQLEALRAATAARQHHEEGAAPEQGGTPPE